MLAKQLGPDVKPKTLQIWFQNRLVWLATCLYPLHETAKPSKYEVLRAVLRVLQAFKGSRQGT